MSNDRFKFRVWDNHCKRYGLPPYIRRSREDCYIYDVETPQENPELVQHHFVLEQCTGLRDRNDKLIYEGDILGDGEEIAVVTWDEECYILEYPDGSIGEFALWCKRFAVIGTIHDEQFRDVSKLISGEEE